MSWVQSPPTGRALSYLQWKPLISYNGCLGPVNDFREGQLPAGGEKHRDAASLGDKAGDVASLGGPWAA